MSAIIHLVTHFDREGSEGEMIINSPNWTEITTVSVIYENVKLDFMMFKFASFQQKT